MSAAAMKAADWQIADRAVRETAAEALKALGYKDAAETLRHLTPLWHCTSALAAHDAVLAICDGLPEEAAEAALLADWALDVVLAACQHDAETVTLRAQALERLAALSRMHAKAGR